MLGVEISGSLGLGTGVLLPIITIISLGLGSIILMVGGVMVIFRNLLSLGQVVQGLS